jgi:hypothetical protein
MYPPEADMYPNWKPAPVGTPQEIDDYLDYLAHVWAEEVKCTSPQK